MKNKLIRKKSPSGSGKAILFTALAANIKMWDDSIEDFEMILAARDAQIHEDIMAYPEGCAHRLIEARAACRADRSSG